MNRAVVCISSNFGDKGAKVADAVALMNVVGDVKAQCIPFEFPALNGRDEDYVNTVLTFETALSLDELTSQTKLMEQQMGRTPRSKALGCVPIDIDIVIWNGEALRPDEAAKPYFMLGMQRMNVANDAR